MPIYIYEHPTTGERREVVQRMTEQHVYFESGLEWKRVFEAPNAKVEGFDSLDPFDRRGFVNKTASRGMTVGDMWDESKRLSDLRTKKLGKDPVKEKTKAAYKHRTGKPHPLSNQ